MTVQQRLVKNNWFRLAVSVTLTLAVLVVFVFAPFNTAHAIVGVDDAIIVVLIAGLASVGITFASTGGFNTLNEYVGSLLEEYAADNNTTVFGVTNGVNASANAAGKLLLNNRFILLIDTFARWLKLKFNLSDNQTTVAVSGEMTWGDYTAYNLPIDLINSTYEYAVEITTGSNPVYAIMREYTSNNHLMICAELFSVTQFACRYKSGRISNGWTTATATLAGNQLYYHTTLGFQEAWFPNNGFITTTDSIQDIMDGITVAGPNPATDSIDINTDNIVLPLDDTNYQTGDGAILDVGATWGRPYTGVVNGEIPAVWPQVIAGTVNPAITYEPEGVIEEQLPAPSDIENLPSGSWFGLPNGFEGLRLSSIWHYVVQWISDTATAGGLLWNTANAMPSPVVNMVFAMVVVAIVFGVLKSLRAH